MNTFDAIAADIDTRIEHINGAVACGAKREDVVSEQFTALLNAFSRAHGLDLACITRVSEHLRASEMWDRRQLAAFSASLRANNGPTRLHQPGVSRGMQNCNCLE